MAQNKSSSKQNQFVNLVGDLNDGARAIGLKNAREWADVAVRMKLITDKDKTEINKLINYRNVISHGGAGKVNISESDVDAIKYYVKVFENNKQRVAQHVQSKKQAANQNNQPQQQKPQGRVFTLRTNSDCLDYLDAVMEEVNNNGTDYQGWKNNLVDIVNFVRNNESIKCAINVLIRIENSNLNPAAKKKMGYYFCELARSWINGYDFGDVLEFDGRDYVEKEMWLNNMRNCGGRAYFDIFVFYKAWCEHEAKFTNNRTYLRECERFEKVNGYNWSGGCIRKKGLFGKEIRY